MTYQPNRRAAIAGALALAACSRAPTPTARPKIEEGFTEVPGGKVWWRRVGDGPGTPLLLLHGGPGSGHNYLKPLAALADKRPVIFYDQLGCGKSDAPEDPAVYSFPRSVGEVMAVRKALGLEKVILFGHSWGAMLAIEYLLSGEREGVEKLVLGGALASVAQATAGMLRLIAALPNGDKLADMEARGQQASPEYRALVDAFYANHLCRKQPPPPEVLETIENLGKSPAYRIMNGPNEFTITGVIKDWDRRADLPGIKVPTHIITGQYDEVTLDCHETIRDGIAGSTLTVMPDCSHLIMNEQPDAYNAEVRHFIDPGVA